MIFRKYSNFGENAAVKYLKKQKYKILERNFRTKFGEVDIIAEDGEIIVFAEVKQRKDERFARAAEAVNAEKQFRIKRMALYYAAKYRITRNMRYDVIEVIGERQPEIRHMKDAFR